MKVLFITSWYPNSVNSLKGIFVKKHAQSILNAGADIKVLALSINHSKKLFEKKVSCFADEKGLDTHLIELNSRFYKLIHLHIWYQYYVLKRYYSMNLRKEFKPQVINSVVLYPAGILGHRLAKQEKCPHVIIEHWSKVDRFMTKSLFAGIGKKAYSTAKKIIVVSNFTKTMLAKYAAADKIVVIPNVIDTALFHHPGTKSSATPLVFACAAHWTAPKRPELVFASLQHLAASHKKPVLLHVIGEGPDLEKLKSQHWDFAIRYHGSVAPSTVASVFKETHYFLHASDIETFSVVIAEALSTGLPVLASNVGAIPELISKENGLVCENTSQAWTTALMALLNHGPYDTLAISSAAQERFNINRIGTQFIKVYRDVYP